MGRYVTEDPIGFGEGINFYGYANANPHIYFDPTGETSDVLVRTLPWIGAGGTVVVTTISGVGSVLGITAAGSFLAGVYVGSIINDGINAYMESRADNAKQDDDCNNNDKDKCDQVLSKWQLKKAGVYGNEHDVKSDELGTKKNLSKYDLCGCKDGRVVIKFHGCKGPIITSTPYRWK
jgi:uncharacterized protein RhaS with RHS repeats